jgi:hypothetical protein
MSANETAITRQRKNRLILGLSPLGLLTLAACGGGSTSTPGSSTTAVTGKVENGPLQGAWAFLDYHIGNTGAGDGVYDAATEMRVLTGGTDATLGAGSYELSATKTGYTLVATTTAETMDT